MTEIEFTISNDSLDHVIELAKSRKSTISEVINYIVESEYIKEFNEVDIKIEFQWKILKSLDRLARINDCTRKEMLTQILKKAEVNSND